MTSSRDDKEALSVAGPLAGTAVGCAIVFFILGVLAGLWLRRPRSHQPSAKLGSHDNISTNCDLATSSTMTRQAEHPGTTSSEDASDHSNNVYDELKARNDDSKATYTSLRFQNESKECAEPSDYINTRKCK
ncbi:hypothetical protein C0Q70_15155 [Pomacea canaliculata]|uniref:Uncharacterized protein n=2 Tax=Pomacea canaliculata TaxID=400727 RepID=A0A2T7NU18_POMCA|nr:hypothetical protein C0Q70_15155 [Pomacea canaliculata]